MGRRTKTASPVGPTAVDSLTIRVSKPRLPKSLAYPLKTSVLEGALRDAGLTCDLQLVYWTQQAGRSVLEAHYWLPNERISHDRVYVRAGSLPAEARSAAAGVLLRDGLPSFVAWLSRIIALPVDSPLRNQNLCFNAEYVSVELLRISSSP